jgi:hypothetical protein
MCWRLDEADVPCLCKVDRSVDQRVAVVIQFIYVLLRNV